MSTSRHTFLLVALLLAGLHAWMAAGVSPRLSPAYDETAHLIAGTTYWRDHDYRLQPENGLLPQLWATIPLVLDKTIAYPRADDPAWARADVWQLGDELLYRTGNDPGVILQRSRAMIALLGGALVLLIMLWARSLFGARGGYGAGVVACFSPTLLAHAGLVTSDTAGALGYTAAILAWWRLCHRLSPGRIAAAGAATAFLALSKYSVAMLPFVVLLLIVTRILHPVALPSLGRRLIKRSQKFLALAGASFVAAVIAWGLIWCAYGFRYQARGPATSDSAGFTIPWEKALIKTPFSLSQNMADGSAPPYHTVDIKPGVIQTVVSTSANFKFLPEAWLYGLTFVDRYSRSRLAFFSGDWRITGWTAFFPVAYLLKSTPTELLFHIGALAFIIGGARLSASRRRLLYRTTPLLAGLFVYGAFAITSKLNIGHRHLLPLYALACVLVGGVLLPALAKTAWSRWQAALVSLLLLLHVLTSLHVRPHYLAYFNSLAGGADGGHRYFVDSSLDWGQSLPDLRDWLQINAKGRPLNLSYFGNGDPLAYGIVATRTADADFDYAPFRPSFPELKPGLYAISATMWQRVYTQVRGPWTPGYEKRYQEMLRWLRASSSGTAPIPLHDAAGNLMPASALPDYLRDFDQLRFGRLLAFLRTRQPLEIVAHTWLIFELDETSLNTALYENNPVGPAQGAKHRAESE